MTRSISTAGALSPPERLDWLQLIRSDNVGPVTFHRLLQRFGSAGAALEALPELARRGGRSTAIRIYPRSDAERELEALQVAGARSIASCEPDYPPLLKEIVDSPPLIGVLGNTSMLSTPAVAMVGSRNASLNGRRFAHRLAEDLGAAGFIVVSGFARGIDTAVHMGALATGTTGVLAGGIDVIYPRENTELYGEMIARGALISEVELGIQPQARHFPRRNRLISGIARGVVVVEANMRSGSLITARTALDQGREVFAVPGSPMDPRARGANDLIRQGATLTESADDVLGVFNEMKRSTVGVEREAQFEAPLPAFPDDAEIAAARLAIAENLSSSPVTVDEIIRTCQLSPAVVTNVLLEWELAGRLERHPGNKISLILSP